MSETGGGAGGCLGGDGLGCGHPGIHLEQLFQPFGVVLKAAADVDSSYIVLPKTSSGVSNSTNIEYLLRNIGIDTLIVTGFLTDQCVDHTLRDVADRGFYPICVSDGRATHSESRHKTALGAFAGYCRTMTTDELVAEISAAD